MEARSRNHCCREKAVNIIYSAYVSVALLIRHAKRMRLIMLSSVGCLALPYLFHLSHKRSYLRKKSLSMIYVVIFSTTFKFGAV
jgi:hypothetical protein